MAFGRIREWETKGGEIAPFIIDACSNEIAFLEKLSLAAWIETLRLIRTRGMEKDYYGRYDGRDGPDSLGHMLTQDCMEFPETMSS